MSRRWDREHLTAYEGLGIGMYGGDSWEFVTAGMHARYARAAAVSDNTVLVSASTGRADAAQRSIAMAHLL